MKNIFVYLHFTHPTKDQETVLKALEAFVNEENQEDFMVLCGAAGTGKTSVTAALIGYLNHLERPYKIAAQNGRVARILKSLRSIVSLSCFSKALILS